MIHYVILMPGYDKSYIVVAEKLWVNEDGQTFLYKGEDIIAIIPKAAAVINSHYIFENNK